MAEDAYEQAWVFGAHFAFMQTATSLRRDGERIRVGLSDFPDVSARAVILATRLASRAAPGRLRAASDPGGPG